MKIDDDLIKARDFIEWKIDELEDSLNYYKNAEDGKAIKNDLEEFKNVQQQLAKIFCSNWV